MEAPLAFGFLLFVPLAAWVALFFVPRWRLLIPATLLYALAVLFAPYHNDPLAITGAIMCAILSPGFFLVGALIVVVRRIQREEAREQQRRAATEADIDATLARMRDPKAMKASGNGER